MRLATALVAAIVLASTPAPAGAGVHPLRATWSVQTRGSVVARPVESGGVVYAGSWDGREYAIRAADGHVLWKTALGTTASEQCAFYRSAGVTSAPSVAGGSAYLGGGGPWWYALDAASGTVRWRVPTGDNSPNGGHYNWSSPALLDGYAYVGISSFCDSPLVPGQLLRVDLATHAVDRVLDLVPYGGRGGSIWTSPVVDPGRRRIFITTGNGVDPLTEAVVAVDADTLEPLGSWRLPEAARVADSDWGTSPTLFTDSRGRDLVAAANKNGYLYAFARDRLSEGPVWRSRVAAGGSCPNCGAGTASTGTFDGRRLFQAGGSTKIGGHRYAGSVRALDPASGRVLWSRGLPGPVLGALARAPGSVVVAAESGLYVLRTRDGAVLHVNRMRGDRLWGAPLVDGRRVVVGTLNGRVRAYRLRTGAAAPRRPAPRPPGP